MPSTLFDLAAELGRQLQVKQWQLALAESCTGGGIAKIITDVPGSSAWFDRGFITYSNSAKVEMLGVSQLSLERFGAVSQQAALEMVAGALERSHADLAFAVTGIAGPGGGGADKPVGTVYIARQVRAESAVCVRQQFNGDRCEVRREVTEFCLRQALRFLADISALTCLALPPSAPVNRGF